MSVSTTITVVGVKDTINALRKIDPQLQKDFKADATAIAQPAINAGKAVYKDLPLSGMKYKMDTTRPQTISVHNSQSGQRCTHEV